MAQQTQLFHSITTVCVMLWQLCGDSLAWAYPLHFDGIIHLASPIRTSMSVVRTAGFRASQGWSMKPSYSNTILPFATLILLFKVSFRFFSSSRYKRLQILFSLLSFRHFLSLSPLLIHNIQPSVFRGASSPPLKFSFNFQGQQGQTMPPVPV